MHTKGMKRRVVFGLAAGLAAATNINFGLEPALA